MTMPMPVALADPGSQAVAESSDRMAALSVSVVIPTFRERDNLEELILRLDAVRQNMPGGLELILVDDNSNDGTEEWVAQQALHWVRLVVRRTERGLSSAVLEGFRHAENDVLLVMDADLSHPPEKIPELVERLAAGADSAVGSRFVKGGSTDDQWSFFRWLNSKVATSLALPLTTIKDPMSGFFALRRETFEQADRLNPVGYKIGLELLTKCRCRRVGEVPIHFSDRKAGKSKLCLREQLRYLQHIRRLYIYRFAEWAHLVQFLAVGVSGIVVNLLLLTLLVAMNVPAKWALGLAIAGSMVTNFILNRRFSFSYARRGSWLRQFAGFVAACSLGAVVNYFASLGSLALWPAMRPQVAALLGAVAGTGFNYAAIRFGVYRKKARAD